MAWPCCGPQPRGVGGGVIPLPPLYHQWESKKATTEHSWKRKMSCFPSQSLPRPTHRDIYPEPSRRPSATHRATFFHQGRHPICRHSPIKLPEPKRHRLHFGITTRLDRGAVIRFAWSWEQTGRLVEAGAAETRSRTQGAQRALRDWHSSVTVMHVCVWRKRRVSCVSVNFSTVPRIDGNVYVIWIVSPPCALDWRVT